MEVVKPTYQASYAPGCDVSVDESLIPFKGRLSFKQYLPLKPKKWGIKFFVLADSLNGFCLDWKAYTGKEAAPRDGDNMTTRVVKELMEPYYESGRSVYMDSFYSSPDLYEQLRGKNIGACGTVRINRRGMPADMRAVSMSQRKGDDPAFFKKGKLLGVTWHDTKRVNVLSTIHGTGTVEKEIRDRNAEGGHRAIKKPQAIDSYNQGMNGVDMLDQRMSYYRYPHRHLKWYMVVYHFMMEVALVNAHLSYRMATGDKAKTARRFRKEVANSLCSAYSGRREKGRPKLLREENREDLEYKRLNERHFSVKIRVLDSRPNCVVCSSAAARKQTRYQCRECNLPCVKGSASSSFTHRGNTSKDSKKKQRES